MEQAVSTRHGRKQSHNQLAAGPCITRRILLCTPVRPSPVYSTHQHRLQLSHRMHSALMCVPQQNRELHRNTKRNFIFVLCRLMLVESHLAQEDPTKNCSYKFVMRRKLTRCVGMEWNGMAWRGMECVLKLVLPSHWSLVFLRHSFMCDVRSIFRFSSCCSAFHHRRRRHLRHRLRFDISPIFITIFTQRKIVLCAHQPKKCIEEKQRISRGASLVKILLYFVRLLTESFFFLFLLVPSVVWWYTSA